MPRQSGGSVDGILNIDKPAGLTSHDVVARARKLLQTRQIGHAGTLDPMATGVLLLCIGEATRVSEYLMSHRKVYRAVVRLGISTDTYDLDGQIEREIPVPSFDRQTLEAVLAPFRGTISQLPPVYSALKQHGVPLYKLARQGAIVQVEPRTVEIFKLELLGWAPPDLTLEITCSPGTYIRSLAHDIGEKLGVGGTLASLRRLRSGSFTADDGVTLEALADAAADGSASKLLHPMQVALEDMTPVPVDAEEEARLRKGLPIPCTLSEPLPLGFALSAAEQGESVVAILRFDPAGGLWRPQKVFGTPA